MSTTIPKFTVRRLWGWAAGGGGLALAILLWALLGRTALFRLEPVSSGGTYLAADRGAGIGQSFISYYPGLAQIRVQADDAGLPADRIVTLHLRELWPEARDRLTLRKSLAELRDGTWLTFAFAPLDESTFREYVFVIESPGEAQLLLAADNRDIYPEGVVPAQPEADLVFQVGYRGAVLPTFLAALTRVTAYKPGLLGKAWFYVATAAAFGITLAGAAVSLYRQFFPARLSEPGKAEHRP